LTGWPTSNWTPASQLKRRWVATNAMRRNCYIFYLLLSLILFLIYYCCCCCCCCCYYYYYYYNATGMKIDQERTRSAKTANSLVYHCVLERDRIPLSKGYGQALEQKCPSLGLGWPITVMRRPISCTSSTAIMTFHVPAVSMATGQNMCVLAKLAYFFILCFTSWWTAAPGVPRVGYMELRVRAWYGWMNRSSSNKGKMQTFCTVIFSIHSASSSVR